MSFERYLDIPFKSQGRDHDGCDCWGLVCLIYREQRGIELTAFADTPASALRDVAKLIDGNKGEWLKVDRPRPLDVVLMRAISRETSRLVAHVGIVIDGRRVLHINEGRGCRAEKLNRPEIAGRIMEIRRHPLVA